MFILFASIILMGNTCQTNSPTRYKGKHTRTNSEHNPRVQKISINNEQSKNQLFRKGTSARKSRQYDGDNIMLNTSEKKRRQYNEIVLLPSVGPSSQQGHTPVKINSLKQKDGIVLTPLGTAQKYETKSQKTPQKEKPTRTRSSYHEILITPEVPSIPSMKKRESEIVLTPYLISQEKELSQFQQMLHIPSQSHQRSSQYHKQSFEILLDPEPQPMKRRIEESAKKKDKQELTHLRIDSSQLGTTKDSGFFINNSRMEMMGWQDFFVLNYLGKGQLGQVFVAEEKQKICDKVSCPYAIKRIKKANLNLKKLKENIKIQNQCLKISHSRSNFLTRIFHSFQNDQYYYLVMQHALGGSLSSFLKRQNERSEVFDQSGEEVIRFILGSTILGLEYLHDRNIVYQDLKPENLLVFQDGYIKLADFGLTRQSKDNHYYMKAGTLCYYAPQIVFGIQCEKYVDFWALGVLAYQLTNLSLPFGVDDLIDSQKFLGKATQATTERKWPNTEVSQSLKDLINKLLVLQPHLRLGSKGWKQIKQHDFFKSKEFDWRLLESKRVVSPLFKTISDEMEKKKIYLNYLNIDNGKNLYTIEQMFSNTISEYADTPKYRTSRQLQF